MRGSHSRQRTRRPGKAECPPAGTEGRARGGPELGPTPLLVGNESRPRVAILCSGNMAAKPVGKGNGKGKGGAATLAGRPAHIVFETVSIWWRKEEGAEISSHKGVLSDRFLGEERQVGTPGRKGHSRWRSSVGERMRALAATLSGGGGKWERQPAKERGVQTPSQGEQEKTLPMSLASPP